MEIKIDTSKDSKAEIRQAIALLQRLVGEQSSIESSDVPTPSDGVFNLFNDDDNNNTETYDDDDDEDIPSPSAKIEVVDI